MKKIVLTGGGTAGHVTPNIALLPSLKEAGYEVFYIGSYTGNEKTLIEDLGIPCEVKVRGETKKTVEQKSIGKYADDFPYAKPKRLNISIYLFVFIIFLYKIS